MTEGFLPGADTLSYGLFETVCGNDTRVQVTQTDTAPYHFAAHLRISFNEGDYVGSAFPIMRSDKHIVFATSGHCVYANGRFANSIQLSVARNAAEKPYGTFVVNGSELRTSAGWKAGGNQRDQFDYGALLISADSEIAGILEPMIMSDDDLENLVINDCGYPADKPYATMWWCGGPVTGVEPRMIRYMADTYGGQSGSPIYTWNKDNELRAVAIHGYGGCPNGAVRFTQAVYDDFLAWAES
ncbi:MAG: hypothetical protein M9941_00905 [Anaerolineae bacterium]|nr:hypothetical protein [Anaerolineae bacterium]